MTSVERRDEGASIRLERALEPFTIDIRPDRRRIVVVPRGELDIATVDQLAAEVDELVALGFETIVLDLRATSFLDSTGLRLLLSQTARPDAQVTIIDGAPAIRRVIDVAGVSGLPVDGCRRRPRHEGSQRQRALGAAYAGQRR